MLYSVFPQLGVGGVGGGSCLEDFFFKFVYFIFFNS